MVDLYQAQVDGSLIEIDENGNERDLYILATAPGTNYDLADYIFGHLKFNHIVKPNVTEIELSLINDEDFIIDQTLKMEKYPQNNKYRFVLYGNKNEKYWKELLVKYTREMVRKNEPNFNFAIEIWEEELYNKAKILNIELFRSTIWFEKVFSFIMLGGTTKYKEFAELFGMPRKLYERFEVIYKIFEDVKKKSWSENI